MKLSISRDYFDNPIPPSIYLCNTSKKIIGELPAYEMSGNFKWNTYSEIQFSVDRTYVDILTGETNVHPLFDKVESPRNVYVKNIGYFSLQDVDTNYADKDTKSVTAFSLEYATLGTKYLTSFKINKGEVDSKEVIYLASIYGEDYSPSGDNQYTKATGAFDPYESYYIKDYTDNDSYVWQQVEIRDVSVYSAYDGTTVAKTLYVQKYPRVRFYHPTNPELSLLHLILDQAPEWRIGNVDATLWRKERSFDETRVAIYDFLTGTVAETFNCVVEFDSISGTINFYEEMDDGLTEDNEVATRWETDVIVSRENLANEINISYSSDNIKTKLTVSGADDFNISEVNLDRNEIMNLSFYHSLEWMEQDLFDAYGKYLRTIKEAETGLDSYGLPSLVFPMSHSEAVQKWVAAQNKYNDVVHAVPAENDTVLIGDEFKKLYCTYTPIDNTADAIAASLKALIKKLNQYHVDEDTSGNKTDNILLKLKNTNGDVATIRIYDPKVKYDGNYNAEKTYYKKEERASGVETYEKLTIPNATAFASYDKNSLYTNNYTIQCVVVMADTGISGNPSYWSMEDWDGADLITPKSFSNWVAGNLTAQEMGLVDEKGNPNFTVSYIGTMGAYLVLSKNEFEIKNNELVPSKSYLRQYGVNLLQEKHDIYTKIFQVQTEAMFSLNGYQCTVGDNPPTGTIANGTRWLDTDSIPVTLKTYDLATNSWRAISASLSPTEQAKYEDYQRYIDNYQKLKVVQEVLSEKEREANYCSNGYAVPNRTIDFSLYTRYIDDNEDGKIDERDFLRYNGELLEANMERAAEAHFAEISAITGKRYTITRVSLDENLPLYTFLTSFDPSHIFAVYLNGTTPYVSYADSRGVYQMIRDYIRNKTEMSNFFTEDQWIRLSPFIREDEFSDSNFLLTGYESEEERIKICKELMDAAAKELNTLCQPSLEFSMTMANILAIPEFAPLIDQFKLGNFIRVHIRDGYIKRARILEVNLNFDDLSDFSCTFGNLITTKSEIDKHAELLAQAVSAGKQVATAASNWQRAVDKSNKLEEAIANGLQDAALQIGRANGQAISWDENGFYCRKFANGSTEQYEDEQIAIINNKIVFTNDGWKTSKAALGEFQVDTNGDNKPETMYGLLADAVVSGYIKGSTIDGGSLKIGGTGGTFIVNEDGSVQILGPQGVEKYADNRYQIRLEYVGKTVFSDLNDECIITCSIYDTTKSAGEQNITQKIIDNGGVFTWGRSMIGWTPTYVDGKPNVIKVKNTDIDGNSQIDCVVDFDETKFDI